MAEKGTVDIGLVLGIGREGREVSFVRLEEGIRSGMQRDLME